MSECRQQPKTRAKRVADLAWWKKLILGVFTATFVLTLFEGCLWLLGVEPLLAERDPFVGFFSRVPHFEERAGVGHLPRMRTATNKLSYLNDQSFAVTKAETAYRIFCLGGSTTVGRPYGDGTSFVGWLRTLVDVAAPEQEFEVVNAGGVSYASYRVAALMEELIEFEPDLFVIYAGHNEFLEARTYHELRQSFAMRKWLTYAATQTRTATLIDRLWQSASAGPPAFKMSHEVKTILDETVGPTSYERDDVVRQDIVTHYELSLRRMIDLARSAGAYTVFVRPACNIRECSPFKSQPLDGLTARQHAACSEAFGRGQQYQQQKRYAMAVDAFTEALAIDDRRADVHYQLGQCLFALGRFEQAKGALQQAADEDVCPLRMTSDVGAALDRVVAERSVPMIDMQAILEQDCLRESGHTVLGREFFLDHVHLTIAAHGLLAAQLATHLNDRGLLPQSIELSSQVWAEIERRVHSGIDADAHAKAEGNLARVLYWAGKVDEAGPLALKCHSQLDDPRIFLIAGVYSLRNGETDRALGFLRRAQQMAPDDGRIRQVLETLGDTDAAPERENTSPPQ